MRTSMKTYKIKRRLLSVVLCIAMLAAIPIPSMAASSSMRWVVSGTTLTVSGSGETGTPPEEIVAQKGQITELVLEDGIITISPTAFSDFSALEKVTFPSTLRRIQEAAFRGCRSLQVLDLPEGLTEIERYAFYDCVSMMAANNRLPDSIAKIGEQAFCNCAKLDLVALPKSPSHPILGEGAFMNTDLHSLHDLGSIYRLNRHVANDNIAHERTEEGIPARCFMGSNLESVNFENRIVLNSAFANCSNLRRVNMPAVYNIGNRAFANCTNLEISAFPESLTNIGNLCFYMCRKITAGRMPYGMSPEWQNNNFVGAGWGVVVEVYTESLDGGYNYRNSFTLPARALWMVQPDTSGETPNIRIYFNGDTMGLEGDDVEAAMSGEDIYYTAADMDTLPSNVYKLVHGEDKPFRLDAAINPDVVRLYYQVRNTQNNYRVEHYLVSDAGVESWQNAEGLFAPVGTHVAAEPKNYVGYHLNLSYPGTVTSGDVTEDGSLVLRLYYTKGEVATGKEPEQIQYNVEHYTANNGAYTLYKTEKKFGILGYDVYASAIDIPGYMENTRHSDRLANGTLTEESTLTLKLYYDVIPSGSEVIVKKGQTVLQLGTLTVKTSPSNAGVVEETRSTSSGYKRYSIVPNANHGVQSVTLDGETLGSVTEFSVKNDGRPHLATVLFDCPSLRYEDVAITAWYHGVVDDVILKGYMIGTGAYTEQDIVNGASSAMAFQPEAHMTRAEVAQTMYRACGGRGTSSYNLYEDVDRDAWYTTAITWATEEGIVQGYGDNTFGPTDMVTREQFVTILHRYAGSPRAKDKPDAPDTDSVSPFAVEAMAWAVQQGIIVGDEDGLLLPQGGLTRAQAAAVISRFFSK